MTYVFLSTGQTAMFRQARECTCTRERRLAPCECLFKHEGSRTKDAVVCLLLFLAALLWTIGAIITVELITGASQRPLSNISFGESAIDEDAGARHPSTKLVSKRWPNKGPKWWGLHWIPSREQTVCLSYSSSFFSWTKPGIIRHTAAGAATQSFR